jgi:hypothetical protein
MNRNRLVYAFLTALVVLSGLSIRSDNDGLPEVLDLYLGDALWAVMIFLITGFVFKNEPVWKVAFISLVFCYLIEISQLYQASWILEIRSTFLGSLILGLGFLWSDIIAYTAGIGIAASLEYAGSRYFD